ncbi:MAG: YceI family protein [Acidimicrobiales bacterium]|nr:YceI family protein [Acidimicrobiales bacterium]
MLVGPAAGAHGAFEGGWTMWSRARIALGALALVSIPLGLIFLFLAFLHRNPPPPRPALDAARPAVELQETPPEALHATALEGQWIIERGEEFFVGYRIDERLLEVLAPTTAVGRTDAVDGGFVVRNGSVIAAGVEADLAALRSDDPKRDEALRTRGLETDRYPTARFLLTRAVPLSDQVRLEEPFQIGLQGDLELHGTRRPISVVVDAVVQRVDGRLVVDVAGSISIELRDFGIDPPDVAGMLQVADHGEVELRLRFRSGGSAGARSR